MWRSKWVLHSQWFGHGKTVTASRMRCNWNFWRRFWVQNLICLDDSKNHPTIRSLMGGRGQPFAAGLLRAQPDLPHHGLNPFIASFGSGMHPLAPRRQARPQQLDRILPLIPKVLTQLVEHPTLALAVTTGITLLQLRQPILFQFLCSCSFTPCAGVFFP